MLCYFIVTWQCRSGEEGGEHLLMASFTLNTNFCLPLIRTRNMSFHTVQRFFFVGLFFV